MRHSSPSVSWLQKPCDHPHTVSLTSMDSIFQPWSKTNPSPMKPLLVGSHFVIKRKASPREPNSGTQCHLLGQPSERPLCRQQALLSPTAPG